MSSMPPGLNFNSPGGSITGTPTSIGTFSFSVMVNDQFSSSTIQPFGISVFSAGGPLKITNAPPNGTIGTAYNFQFNASGGNGVYTWAVNSDGPPLPPGLTLSSGGLLSGSPTTAGTYPFSVFLDDTAGDPEVFGNFTVSITPCMPTFTNPATLHNAEVSINYSEQFAVTGCSAQAYTFEAIGNVPNGLNLTPNGLMSGQAVTAGTYTFTVSVADNTGRIVAENTFTLNVVGPPIFSTTSPLPGGLVGVAYGPLQIQVSGGTAPFTFGVRGTPPGLILLGDGKLQGTPTTAGIFTIFLTVTDSYRVSAPETAFQITIVSGAPSIQVSPTSLTFSAVSGGDAPPSQAISVTPGTGTNFAFSIVMDGGTAGSPAPGWLKVGPASGTAPAQLVVTADQGTLPAGTNTARIRVLDANSIPTDISVTLNITSATTSLTVAPTLMRFAARVQSPGSLQQALAITSMGGNGPVAFHATVLGGSSWISGVTPSSGQTTRNAPVLALVQINTHGLEVGNYHDTIRVSWAGGNVDVAVELFVAQSGSILGVNVTGLLFPAREGAGAAVPQSVKILNLGDPASTVHWTADLNTSITGSDWVGLSPATGTATLSSPGVLTLTPTSASGLLTAGSRYALIRIADPSAKNSPQYVVAVLNVEASTAAPEPEPSPAGLFFTAVAGGAQTAGQTVTVHTSSAAPVPFQAAASTSDGTAWLKLGATAGSASTTSPGSVSVSVDPSKLTAGIYSGSVSFSISGIVRVVNITLVVEAAGTGAGTSTALAVPEAAGCAASKLAVTETGLVNNFSVPAGWPATLIVQLNDDCGALVTSGAVVASFSNGDAPVSLRGDGLGGYSATWQPSGVGPQMVVTLNATSSPLQPFTAKLIGGITANQAPSLAPGGTLNNLNPIVGSSISPGMVAQVYGSGLASGTATPGVLPLPAFYGGTFMLAGSASAPFYFLSNGQLNVQIPNELAPNQQYSVVVSANNALTLPDLIDVVPAAPGVAAFADGHVIAQHNSNFQLVNSSNPAVPGEYIIVYLAGMGATNPSVATGVVSPLAQATVQPTVTLDGQTVNFAYAGLTPGAVGLYQITFQVPANARSGDLNLVIQQGTAVANTTKLTVQ